MKSTQQACIGVALGSGAAKGFSHIGVLKVLDEMGIRPQVIAGTSMGAFVGAAYAAGELGRLEKWVRVLDNRKVFSLLDINWTLSGGVLGGKKPFKEFFESFPHEAIENLPIPFTAIATDLLTGEEIWLQQGNLQEAVSASSSIPGLLAPKRLAGRWLVDGAVVNPLPVDVCRAMGATKVIAVDVTEDGIALMNRQGQVQTVISEDAPQEEPPSPDEQEKTMDPGHSNADSLSGLLAQGRDQLMQLTGRTPDTATTPGVFNTMSLAMDIVERRHKHARLAGSPPDVMIIPKVGSIGGMEFSRAAEAIDAGEAEAWRLRTWLEDVVLNG